MYADIEEERARRGHRASRSSDVEFERSAKSSSIDDTPRSREKELAEQLRKRAQASRSGNNADQPRGRRRSSSVSSRSSRATFRAPSPSRSRSRSRDSGRSRKSHQSRKSASRADEEAEERRKRRRGEDPYRRDRDRLDEDDEERARERRRRRSDRRDDYRDVDTSVADHRRDSPAPSSSRGDRDRYDSYYDDRRYDRGADRGHHRRSSRYEDDIRRAPPRRLGRYDSPAVSTRSRRTPSPEIDDYEERSVFCSQLSSRLGQRDLGEFFEDHLGEGAVQDVRIVTDRVTHRSKGVGYVEFAARELVPKAMELTGTVLFGIPIVVQRTDAARNGAYQGPSNGAMPHGAAPHPALAATQLDPRALANVPLPMQYHTAGAPIHLNVAPPAGPRAPPRPGPNMPNTEARLYVGSLHFSLTDENVKAVFEPFGEIEYVDLHREPGTGKSKGFCFIQFKRAEDAKKAHEQMNGFELAGRAIRVGNVNAKGSGGGSGMHSSGAGPSSEGGGHLPQLTSAFDDGGGAGLNPERRAALMEKLARNNEPSPSTSDAAPVAQDRPAGIPESTSTSLLLKNMFNPAE